MKYEMIFGDEKLFDGAPECATHATKGGGFYYVDSGIVKFISNMFFGARDVCGLAGYLVAERRIIKEPKRWTWEDKKAGRLPEVGCEVMAIDTKMVCTVNAICKIYKSLSLTFPDGSLGMVELEDIDPIETPREKYDRERDECIDKLLAKIPPSPITVVPAMKIVYEELRPFTGDDHD